VLQDEPEISTNYIPILYQYGNFQAPFAEINRLNCYIQAANPSSQRKKTFTRYDSRISKNTMDLMEM